MLITVAHMFLEYVVHLGINITELLVIQDITSLYPYIRDNTVIQVYTIHYIFGVRII